ERVVVGQQFVAGLEEVFVEGGVPLLQAAQRPAVAVVFAGVKCLGLDVEEGERQDSGQANGEVPPARPAHQRSPGSGPVSVRRKATRSAVSLVERVRPSWYFPITMTAASRVATEPSWK